MSQYLVVKLLFIQSIQDTISEGLRLEQEISYALKDGLLVDITVVRECMTALEQLKYCLYDFLVIYDNIDFLSAQEFLRVLRLIGCETHVIFVTDSKPKFNCESYALEHGFTAVLPKPLNPETLVDKILTIMNNNNSQQHLQHLPQPQRQPLHKSKL